MDHLTKRAHTPYIIDEWRHTHRNLGKAIHMTDIDGLEYTFVGGKRKWVAIIDYKNGKVKSISDRYDPIQAQIELADTLQVPFFFVLYYEFPDYQTPAYYVIPINKLARSVLSQGARDVRGYWMTLLTYSQFQHFLRHKIWDENEPIADNRYGAKTLGELPDEAKEYPLPVMSFAGGKE